MSLSTSFENIDPNSDVLPPPLPLMIEVANLHELFANTIYTRATKRDCVNCGLRHSSYEEKENAYCLVCERDGTQIVSWLRKRRSIRRLRRSVLVASVVSRKMNISELGIHDSIVKFL